ncbi:LPS assembly lipoprotein LptE [Sandaracinobacter sp. RS1-74]|uniref:LPS assembly lipoprotein LptE n=1 Tax=Sandaracinobacteroides sayramensis TaxID=2913411 RepID=UPI001EDB4595|nr:LPS assembly lipoprotein LptE [Sandaracinobacteroides sayramensis]MCG2842832.1 LPS assembly lipoprotein LptE [Sandaracinobacteroides sayramensis]
MRALLLALAFLLAGCGLQPVYTGGQQGEAMGLLGAVEVTPIPDKAGFLVRDRLLSRLPKAESPRYRLDVVLDDNIIGFGVRGDNSIIRERRTLRARYRLVDIGTDRLLLDTTAAADAGIDVVSSEYAVIAAEETALERLSLDIADQIVARLALYGRSAAAGAAQP